MGGRPELEPRLEAALRSSLAVFQLGETGEGEHLLGLTAGTRDRDYLVAMRLFVQEEHEHARLLALVLNELDEPLLDRHWTDVVFQTVRRVSGLRAEVLTLLVAEIVGVQYYSTLAQGFADHPELVELFGRIHTDEIRHVNFHADTLPARLEEWPAPIWWAARLIWNVLLYGSSAVVAWDHRKILNCCGVSGRRFFRDCARNIGRYEPRFFRR